jgi:tetratricopeptide (TPR) repeat protein
MGVVYKARQETPNRVVALKMIRGDADPDGELLTRFRAEADAAARLSHPNIVQIYEVGDHQGRPYFTLEFVEGATLAEHVRGTPQPPRDAAALVEVLARAIHHAHQRGVVHRDLKPGNILLADCGLRIADCKTTAHSQPPVFQSAIKVTDFGLAKQLDAERSQTETGAVLGTPSYMAPEQAWGKSRLRPVGAWTDVYALGAILYSLLTARPPFLADTPLETLQLVISEEEPVQVRRLQPKVPADLETICLKCLDKRPHKRYASAEALADDLRRFLEGRPIKARPVGPVGRSWRWCLRHPARATLLVVLILSLGSITALWLLAQSRYQMAERNFRGQFAAYHRFFTRVSEELLLDEPGLQPFRRQMLEEARQAYEGFLVERAGDASLQAEVARTYWRLGKITVELDSPATALPAFVKARALQEPLLAADPSNVQLATDLGRTCTGLGNLYLLERRPEEAALALKQASDLLVPLEAARAGDLGFLRGLAAMLTDRGLAHLQSGEASDARRHFEKARSLRARLARLTPGPRSESELAVSEHHVGKALAVLGQHDQALAAFMRACATHKLLVARHPRLVRYSKYLADHHDAIAEHQYWRGELVGAARHSRLAQDLRERLVNDNPEVEPLRHALAQIEVKLGRIDVKKRGAKRRAAQGLGGKELWRNAAESFGKGVELLEPLLQRGDSFTLLRDAAQAFTYRGTMEVALGERGKAERSFRRGSELFERLLRRYRVLPEDRRDLGELAFFLGTGFSELKQPQRAQAAFARVCEYWEPLLARGQGTEGLMRHLDMTYFTLGGLLRDAGQPAEAARLAHKRRSLRPRDPLLAHDTACELALCAAVLGKRKGALSETERMQQKQFTDEAMVYLREALRLRLPNPHQIANERDFDFLRSRADFQQLLREVGAKPSQ